jgi:vacuolar-type H+-ATPase subunit E/Vma4
MSLDKLVNEIGEETRERVRKMLSEARVEEQKLLENAKRDADGLLASGKARAKEEAKRNSVEALASARLQAKRLEGVAAEAAVNRVFDELASELREFCGKKEYEKVFAKLVEQGKQEIGEDFVLKCNSADVSIARKFGKVAETIECIGGVVVASSDGTIQANNTFDALLEEHAEELKRKAFAELFGKNEKSKAKDVRKKK